MHASNPGRSGSAVAGNVVEDVGPPEAVDGVFGFEDEPLGVGVFDGDDAADGDGAAGDEMDFVFHSFRRHWLSMCDAQPVIGEAAGAMFPG